MISNLKYYKIPTKLPSLLDIKPDIYEKLLITKEYQVKSQVDDDIFQSFINYLIDKKTPNICIKNITQYDKLSEEFDFMRNIVQLFRKISSKTELYILMKKNADLQQQLFEKRNQLQNQNQISHQIFHFLFKNNGISSYSEFSEIKGELYKMIRGRQTHIVDLFTQKKVTQNGFTFILNEEEKTAGVFRYTSKSDTVIIPRSIVYESKEFVVTKIHEQSLMKSNTIKTIHFPENSELIVIEKNSFACSSIENMIIPSSVFLIEEKAFFNCKKLKRIEFSENSKLKKIEKNAFESSSLESISIPSSVELEDGWCNDTSNLKFIEIFINKNKLNYIYFDDKFILGKSDKKNDKFDIIVFARRDIKTVVIPSFIKEIGQYAFNNCSQLSIVEFKEYSKLELIDSFSFSNTSIENIRIPSSVKRIGNSSFSSCLQLKNIKFSEDSKLYSIGKYAFFWSSLESIIIPPLVTTIEESTFMMCSNLNNVEISKESKLKYIEKYAFNSSSIKRFTIPSSMVDFDDFSFVQTCNLIDIEIINNGQVNAIYYDNKFILSKSDPLNNEFDVLVLARRDIENVIIPPFIKRIYPYAFDNCKKIKSIEFSDNSKLEFLGKYSFSLSSIESIKIPSSVILIDTFAFSNCKELKKVEFSKGSKLKILDQFIFSYTSIENILIPSEITKIDDNAFIQCKKLKKVEISEDSKLESIGYCVFSYSSIESLSIPSSIVSLQKYWCDNTSKLNDINITVRKNCENIKYYDNKFIVGKSNLNNQVFDVLYFARRDIERITFPSFIKKIYPYSLSKCKKLKAINFPVNSRLEVIGTYSFNSCSFCSISLPPHVKMIEYAAFNYCDDLQIIEFFDNSEFCFIENSAFGKFKTKIIMIPSKKHFKFFNTWLEIVKS